MLHLMSLLHRQLKISIQLLTIERLNLCCLATDHIGQLMFHLTIFEHAKKKQNGEKYKKKLCYACV